MATIIDCGGGRYIAGDPVEQLHDGRHWCQSCAGSGLDYGFDNELEICYSCNGAGDVACMGSSCDGCASERSKRLSALASLILDASARACTRQDFSESTRLLGRYEVVDQARADIVRP